MKILIDIGHPAHVHYFKNFIWIMQQKGHEFCITSRNKEVAFELLEKYGFHFYNRGTGAKSILGKVFYLIKADYFIYRTAKKFKPDILLSFSSPYAAHASFFLRKPNITFDDTEHAKFEQKFFLPFSDVIFTPSCFFNNLGKKQLFFNGFMELCYLQQKYFKPDENIYQELGLTKNQKYLLIRFVSWNASHDVGQKGMNLEFKCNLVSELSKFAKVFISSEGELPYNLKPYQIKISPEKMHHVLFYADLYIGEGGTMASECAMMGTPAIYINTLTAGTLEEQEEYGLLYSFRNTSDLIDKAKKLLKRPNLKDEFQIKRSIMLADKIDVTAFMVWFIENYPESVNIMNKNPDYQYIFKNNL